MSPRVSTISFAFTRIGGIIADAPQDQIHKGVLTTNIIEVLFPSSSFRDRDHLTCLHSNLAALWLWPLTTQYMDHQDTIRELIYARIIHRIGNHNFRGHVGRSAWSFCHFAGLKRIHIDHPGHAQVGDLGFHVDCEKNVVSREITVNDGRVSHVKILQA